MAQTQKQLPSAEDISISKQDAKEANARKRYRPGWYRGQVKDAKGDVSEKKGSLMAVCKIAMLKDPEDSDSAEKLTVNYWCVLPLRNPLVAGHKIPKVAGMAAAFFRAGGVTFNDGSELRDYPRIDKDTKQAMFEGKPIDKKEYNALSEEVTEDVMKLSQEIWAEPGKLLHAAPYFQLEYQNGSDFPTLKNFRNELPEDAELVHPDQFFEESDDADETEDEFVEEETPAKPAPKAAAKTNGKTNGAAKPTAKAAAKKGKK